MREFLVRAFRGRLVEHRCLDIDEAVVVEVVAHGLRRAVAHAQRLLHRLPAQVEIAVAQAHFLAKRLVVHHERRRDRGIQDLELVGEDLDLPAAQPRIHGSLGAAAHHARHAQDELVAHAIGDGEGLLPVGVAHHLHEPFAVAHVDEDHSSVVAAPVSPAEKAHGLPQEARVGQSAVFGSHVLSVPRVAGRFRSQLPAWRGRPMVVWRGCLRRRLRPPPTFSATAPDWGRSRRDRSRALSPGAAAPPRPWK